MSALPLLLVDDDEDDVLLTRELLAEIPGPTRYELTWVRTAEEALTHMVPPDGSEPDHVLCLLDNRLGVTSGTALLQQARAAGYARPTLLLTGSDDLRVDEEALAVGASDYLVKGHTTADLLGRSIRYALAQKAQEAQIRAAAQALSEARRQEARVGAVIQNTLLLRHRPSWIPSGLSLGVHISGAEQVTGDYCDFMTFRERCFDVILGDVMGKGMVAALVGAAIKSQLQRVARRLMAASNPFERLPCPEEMVGALQSLIVGTLNHLECFVTLHYARFELERSRVVYVDAGHPSPIHWRAADRRVHFLRGDNLPLGISDDEFYSQQCHTFAPGDIFVFYSDGLTEARNAEGEEFGLERLCAVIDPTCTPQELADRLCATVQAWRSGIGDDLTCLVVRIDAIPPLRIQPQDQAWFEFPSHPDELEEMRLAVEDLCQSWSASDGIDMVLIGLNEAVANVMEHAYSGRTDQRIRLTVQLYRDRVVFQLSDRGKHFATDRVAPPQFDGSQDNGFGWFLIKECFDNVSYSRDDIGWNHLTLTKNRSTTEG